MFWSVYKAITDTYPIGVRFEDPLYHEYVGYKNLNEKIVKHIHENNMYQKTWSSAIRDWKKIVHKNIYSETDGQQPSFNGYILLSDSKSDSRIVNKRVLFSVSLVGSFYTLFGVMEENQVVNSNLKGLPEYRSIVSEQYFYYDKEKLTSENEFNSLFFKTSNAIEDRFSGFSFVPYDILKIPIRGLELPFRDNEMEENSVFHALFNTSIKFKSDAE